MITNVLPPFFIVHSVLCKRAVLNFQVPSGIILLRIKNDDDDYDDNNEC